MREELSFFAHGTPKGQPRVKAFSRGGHAGIYTPKSADDWKEEIRKAAKLAWDGIPFEGPLSVSIQIVFPRPKSHYRTGKNAVLLRPDAPLWHVSKPDRDNCDKAILDTLTGLGIWKDDAQVCDGRIRKVYGMCPGAGITIREAVTE